MGYKSISINIKKKNVTELKFFILPNLFYIVYQSFISSYIVLRIESRASFPLMQPNDYKYIYYIVKFQYVLYEISELIDDRRTYINYMHV